MYIPYNTTIFSLFFAKSFILGLALSWIKSYTLPLTCTSRFRISCLASSQKLSYFEKLIFRSSNRHLIDRGHPPTNQMMICISNLRSNVSVNKFPGEAQQQQTSQLYQLTFQPYYYYVAAVPQKYTLGRRSYQQPYLAIYLPWTVLQAGTWVILVIHIYCIDQLVLRFADALFFRNINLVSPLPALISLTL